METVITIQGMDAIKQGAKPNTPRVFNTSQGKFRVWPNKDNDVNPIVALFENGILQSFMVDYYEKPYTNPHNGRTTQDRYVNTARPATPEETPAVSSVQANAMQNAGQAAQGVTGVAPAQQGTVQTTSIPPDASSGDLASRLKRDFHVSAFWGQANALLHGGHCTTVFDALCHAERDIERFMAGERTYTSRATDTDDWSQTHERPIASEPTNGMPAHMANSPPLPEER